MAGEDARHEALLLCQLLHSIEDSHKDPVKKDEKLRASFGSQLKLLMSRVLPLLGEGHPVMPVAVELSEAISKFNVTYGLAWEDAGYLARSIDDVSNLPMAHGDIDPLDDRLRRAGIVAGLLRVVIEKYQGRQDEFVRMAVRHMLENCLLLAGDLLQHEVFVRPVADDFRGMLIAAEEESHELNGEAVVALATYVAIYLEGNYLHGNGGGSSGYGYSLNNLPALDRRMSSGHRSNR